jgi:hypothetical protein
MKNTAYFIMTDHHTDYICVVAADSKAPSMAWLNLCFAQYTPDGTPFHYFDLD